MDNEEMQKDMTSDLDAKPVVKKGRPKGSMNNVKFNTFVQLKNERNTTARRLKVLDKKLKKACVLDKELNKVLRG